MTRSLSWVFKYVLIFASMAAQAQDVLIARSALSFPEAMSALQNSIIEHKYTLSRVQRIDVGLQKAGFKIDLYRVVFFGKQKELKWISDESPSLLAYLPLKIAIFAEGNETLAVAINPIHYSDVNNKQVLNELLVRWSKDMQSILKDFRLAE